MGLPTKLPQPDEEALQLYRELFATKLQLDLIVFNATVSACEKGVQWEAALRLLQDWHGVTERLSPVQLKPYGSVMV